MTDKSDWQIFISHEQPGNLFSFLHTLGHGVIVKVNHAKYCGDAEWIRADPDTFLIRRYRSDTQEHMESMVLTYSELISIYVY